MTLNTPMTTRTKRRTQQASLYKLRLSALSRLNFRSMMVMNMRIGKTNDVARHAVAPRKENTVSTPGTLSPRYAASVIVMTVTDTCQNRDASWTWGAIFSNRFRRILCRAIFLNSSSSSLLYPMRSTASASCLASFALFPRRLHLWTKQYKFSLIGWTQRGVFMMRVRPTHPLHKVMMTSSAGKFCKMFPKVSSLKSTYPDAATLEYSTTSNVTERRVTFFMRDRSGYFNDE
mmetsp:Transcript_17008/g.23794  ORF Transcript_17008/g.23794 Transcript_17008/m.23794 type:complete len:232 (+) Transcript_17008:295-990(+)